MWPHFMVSAHAKSNLQFYLLAGPMHFHSALCIYLENGRSAFVAWPCKKPCVDDWCYSEAMALLELCVMNWDFTGNLPAVISLNLEWSVWREESQLGVWIQFVFNTPILSPPTTPIASTCDITCSKKAVQICVIWVSETFMPTQWLLMVQNCLHSLRYWEARYHTMHILRIS